MADENDTQENEETPEAVAETDEAATEPEAVQPEAVQPEAGEPEAGGPVAEAEEPVAEEPVAEDEVAAEDAAEPAPAEEAELAAEAEPAEQAEPADQAEPVAESEPAVAPGRKKKKRLPRALRPKRSKPVREKPKERRPITRLPKPEHDRGRSQARQGTVVSAAMDKTIVVRVDTVKVHPRYKKVIRRSSKFHAHDEQNEAKVGDIVLIVETRPLSRTKRWRLQQIVEAAR
jgi:small subunit ribosomal protein S17